MAVQRSCDVCKKATDEIVGKLFYAPLGNGGSGSGPANRYTHHLDVGVCCSDRLLSGFNFRQRKTAKEYAASRRKGTA